jgi:Ca-activated chloride channel homolog
VIRSALRRLRWPCLLAATAVAIDLVAAPSPRAASPAGAIVRAVAARAQAGTPHPAPPQQPQPPQQPPPQQPPPQQPPAQKPPPQTPVTPPPDQPPAGRGQGPSFRAGVELVSLNVTVTDGTAHYVTDLSQDEFTVFEDGVKQDVTFFNRTNLPIALSLLLDTSASMETKLPTAQEAAIGFAKRLRTQDMAEVIDFDSRVIVLQNFTGNAADLEQAIRKTSAGGSTSLYNAVYIALKDLKKVIAKNVEEIRRAAIVLLSDGEDTSSLLPFEEVLDLSKRSETAIYAIGLRPAESPSGGAKSFKEAEFVLRQLAQETGGRAFFPNQLSDLANVYGQISDELSSQYTVGYTSHNPKRDGGWRRVVVRVTRPNLTARTKQGYFAPTSH